ncbi:IS66 family transposase [Bacillus tropicus]|nr:IS66 family transposase [Bacillus tropicus]
MTMEQICQSYHMGLEAIQNLFTEEHLKSTVYIQQLEAENKQLKETVTSLQMEIQKLQATAQKNSSNSHKPPSTDGCKKPITKSLRGKTGRKSGGQIGHKGYRLAPVENPHHIVTHPISLCSKCQSSLEQEQTVSRKKRQVFDLPSTKIEVTQYESEGKVCSNCLSFEEGQFLPHVTKSVQYGPRIQALVVYLTNYQMLSYARTAAYIRDQFGHTISEGTLVHMNRVFGERLDIFEEKAKSHLLQSRIVHFDETGIRVNRERQWIHTMSTKHINLQVVHTKRGKEAMNEIGVLPHFSGIAVHDGWASYFLYKQSQHILCNAHLLRELQGIFEQTGEKWAENMKKLLCDAKQLKEKQEGKLTLWDLLEIEQAYEATLQDGAACHPLSQKRVRPKSVLNNLLPKICGTDLYETKMLF